MKQISLYNIADKETQTYQQTYDQFKKMTNGQEKQISETNSRGGKRELNVLTVANYEGVNIKIYSKLRDTKKTVDWGKQGTYNLVLKGDENQVRGLVDKLGSDFEMDLTLIKKINTAEVKN